MAWVLPGRVVEFLFGWSNWFGKHSSNVWNLVPLCLMWTVWREHDCFTFEDMGCYVIQIIEIFIGSLFGWSHAWGLTSVSSLGDFFKSLSSFHCIHSL